MGLVLFAARLTLAVVFAVAGFAKLRDAQGSRKSLVDFGVPVALTPAVAVLLPLAELACAVALLRDRWIVSGAIGVMALLAVFTVGITVSLARGRAPNCHCFGQLSSSPVSSRTLVRNLVLLALAGVIAWNADDIPSPWPNLPGDSLGTAVIAAIGAFAILLALTWWFLFRMLQQNGRLLLRLETVERKLDIDPNAEAVEGLPVGTPAPAFELRACDGGTVNSQALENAGKPILLVFSDAQCGACESFHPELARWQRQYEGITIVPISRGEVEQNRITSAVHDLRNVLLQVDREVAQAYSVTATPSAVLVAERKIASPIAAGPKAIRALVARTTLPPPPEKGDEMFSVDLQESHGHHNGLGDNTRGASTTIVRESVLHALPKMPPDRD